jgi:hypothetical protein
LFTYNFENKEINSKPEVEKPKYTEQEEELRETYATTSDRLAYLRELRQDSRFERFYKNIANAIEKVGKLEVPVFINPIQSQKQDKQYIVGLADLHLGAAFSAINNKYNIEIAKKRIEDSANYIKDFVLEKGLSEITVLSLGDMIQGMLRTSDLKLNEKDVVDAFVIAERLLAGFLNSLSKYCKVKFIQVCYSNHEQPRYLGTKANELAGEDMGKILFAYLQDVLALNERVEIIGDTEKDYYEFKIFDFECFAEHGHQIKSIADANKNLTNRHRKFYDYVFLAHSHSAKEFITPLTMSTLSGRGVMSEFFHTSDGAWNSHVELGLWADAMIIAPATASTIGKMAGGIADNLLVTTYLSMKAPVFIAPAMDLDMFAHPSTQRNLEILRSYGNHIIEPASGELASHLSGKGRMEEPHNIVSHLKDFFFDR